MMSACPEAAAPVASDPPAAARSQRLARFKREQLIVEYLNRGVSVAEIAARVGVGEKRMRAIIREILARRMPHPPEEFVAIQLSRLNEALLVAYSAMSPTNLKAVDQVVKIVRELDRYGGAFAAEWARPEPSRLDDVEAPPRSAGLCSAARNSGCEDDEAIPAKRARGDRPENPAQGLEKVEIRARVHPPRPASPGQEPGGERVGVRGLRRLAERRSAQPVDPSTFSP